MLKIGCSSENSCIPTLSKESANLDFLFIGQKGSGKTMAMESIERDLAKAGIHVLILNYGGTHDNVLFDKEFYRVVRVKKEGIPIPILSCFSNAEEDADVCEAVVEVFHQMNSMGYVHQSLMMEACERARKMRSTYADDMKCIHDAITAIDEESTLLPKYRNIFTRVKFSQTFDLWHPRKATVLDLAGYSQTMQIWISQLVISLLWRYHRACGQKMDVGTWIVLDEFQNLPLQDSSLVAQILREGRKYKLSLILATQTLSSFNTAKRAMLQQPGTKLYFRPVESDLRRIAKGFPDMDPADARSILEELRVGECLASGEFKIGHETRLRTLKIKF